MTNRRTVLKSIGATAGITSLSGCALFNNSNGGDNGGEPSPSENVEQEIPDDPVKIVFADMQSGPGAVFGERAINAAKLLVQDINENGGILGERQIDPTYLDSAAGSEQMTSEVRSLGTEQNAELLTGFTSSATALAVASISEDLGLPTIFQNTGAIEMFNENDFQYIFRSGGNLAVDSVTAARLVADRLPETETVATINEDYVYGQNHAETFTAAIQQLRPDIEVVATRFTEFQAQNHTSHVSALNEANPDFIYSSLWGGAGVSFVRQASAQGLFDDTEMAFGAAEHIIQTMGEDMPDGLWFGGRGPHWWNFQYDVNPLRKQFADRYHSEYGEWPTQAAFHQWFSLYWYVNAVEEYYTITGGYPSKEDVTRSLLRTSVHTPAGFSKAPGRQAKPSGYFGKTTSSDEYDFKNLTDHFLAAPEMVNPPDSVGTIDWIETL